ncbi:MAG: phasin family protein [Janthinobacterium lividum]
MSSTTFPAADAFSFGRTIADMKQGVDAATGAQSDMTHKAAQIGKDFVAFSQGNMEAFAQASQMFAAGSQDLLREMVSAGQAIMQEAMSNMHAAASAKAPKAAIELQANFVRSSTIQIITESARIAHSSAELAERVSAPLVARMVAGAEMATSQRG